MPGPPPRRPKHGVRSYWLKVTLLGIEPPVSRCFLVRSDRTLAELHDAIQAVMGWHDSHLHEFRTPDPEDSAPGTGSIDEGDETTLRLYDVLEEPGDTLQYAYDFADGWEHDVELVEVLPLEAADHPRPVEGERACPPDGIGGESGYDAFLQAIADPDHPDHDEMLERSGGGFDPEAFDPAAAETRLRQVLR